MQQLELHNQEPAKLGSTPSKGSEWDLSSALKSRRIFLLETDEPIKEALRYAMMVVGIRAQNIPVAEEKQLLINFIKKEYYSHHIDEIRVAFDCAITGKLDVDATCYENFSIQYFAKIFSAYRNWAVQQMTGFKPDKQPKELPAGPVDWSDVWERLKTEDTTSEWYIFTPWSAIYDWLKATKLLALSPAEAWGITERVRDSEMDALSFKKKINKATPEDKANLERLKCIDWKTDKAAMNLLITKSKELAVKELIQKIKHENADGHSDPH